MANRTLKPRQCRTGTEPGMDCYNTGLAPRIGRSKCGEYYIVGTELAVQDAYNRLRRGASPRAIHAEKDGRWFPVHIYATAAPAWRAYDAANEKARERVRADIREAEARRQQILTGTAEEAIEAILR